MRVRGLRSSGAAVVAVLLLALVLTGCEPRTLSITTTPALFPRFSTSVPDYVSRCDDSAPVQVSISAPSGTTVTVEGAASGTGTFTTSVTRDVGQDFTIVVQSGSGTTTHHVRCLPGDFPSFTAQRTGRTQSEYYVTAPSAGVGGSSYPIVFDTNGVPVWWGAKTAGFFALLLPDGHVAWNNSSTNRVEEYTFDGQFVRSYRTVGQQYDFHDLVVLPNGNALVVSVTQKPHVDLSSWGGPSDATIFDHTLQEVTPQGAVAWSWVTSEHVPVTETTQHWRDQELAEPGGTFGDAFDPYHYNSIEPTPDGTAVVVSFRHLDAVLKIDKATGNIVWKLGGTTTPASLDVVGDREFQPGGGGGFGGQHDARLLDADTVSIYDDGSGRARPPRGVTYDIDETAGTATLVQTVRDPLESNVFCCGSFRRLPGGNVVFGWGGNANGTPDITESTRAGARLFALDFTNTFVYRGIPVLPGVLNRDVLRSGMDAQFGTG